MGLFANCVTLKSYKIQVTERNLCTTPYIKYIEDVLLNWLEIKEGEDACRNLCIAPYQQQQKNNVLQAESFFLVWASWSLSVMMRVVSYHKKQARNIFFWLDSHRK